jgi:hypothetical protein
LNIIDILFYFSLTFSVIPAKAGIYKLGFRVALRLHGMTIWTLT